MTPGQTRVIVMIQFVSQVLPRRAEATVRFTPAGIARLSGPAAEAAARTGVPEPDGWTRAVLPIESEDHACREYLAFGPEIEVLAPRQLRDRLAAAARATAALY
jgi:predicted DNA-binding transcriptional regulator YafY